VKISDVVKYFSEVQWNGILDNEEERGPEISNIINGK